jgi:formate dehydrogenase major subunit
MTNHWIDMTNADVVLIMGSNAAENHPIAMNWIRKTKERGAIILSVDPRFTRTSHLSDVYAKIRSGTDIAFVGGMIRYALEHDRVQRDYVREYTNASFLVRKGFGFESGLFSGYDPATRGYDTSTWAFELDAQGRPAQDLTLRHPRSVFQLLKAHFARYDPDTVCSITGTPKDVYLRVCDIYTSTFAPTRVGNWLYAMGTTQHTHGTQNIRCYAILQLLLGNIGVAGGGVNALRGLANVQGSTDFALLFHLLPGYLRVPVEADADLAAYLKRTTPASSDPKSVNWWKNNPKYVVSLLKAWWGAHAVPANDFAFQCLPKIGKGFQGQGYHWIALFEAMYAGQLKGLVCIGQNPAVCGPNANLTRPALERLDWLVAVDLFETETASFWRRPGADPATIKTEVFLLPAASSVEKEGSLTNSARWVQWRSAAVPPAGQAKPDLWILDRLCRALKAEYAKGGAFPEPIVQLAWEYGEGPDPHRVAREINGSFLADVTLEDGRRFVAGSQLPGFAALRDDGTTASGNWIYSGMYTQAGNQAARRGKTDAPNGIGLYPGWAWAWPANRRIMYNRASVDPQGRPWDPKRWVISWNAEAQKWEGDVPDGPAPPGAAHPFIMLPTGLGGLFGLGLRDGPFPEHYEPVESPIRNPLSRVQFNPTVKVWDTKDVDRLGTAEAFPIVATTYRVSEHMDSGGMTRNMPVLYELMPDAFVELGRDLARRKRIKNGDRVVVSTARGSMEAYALVTDRFEPFWIQGRVVDQIGIPWHWGYAGAVTGDSANLLTPHVGDANTSIPEYKAFLCEVRRRESV